ncbi:hypothetical protein MHC_03755 [Mycoplasma haemocanis str. Illinois]|uniref:Uncharacterized protein n=1 Tax=Mycoplasma haemocanis (strain Illinois) TaxID=1111676 RepID=H6N7I9_MYCHN|nr:hypothetical protein [Mycoplasma haemocanis]AEW45611.1 hypothetical protein MHC_03755 [Mycoplasma haemocanis str. Illinois]
MNPVTKIVATVLSIGGVSTAGGYAWHLSQLSTLSSLIKSDEEVTQLTKDSSEGDWNEAWTSYKTSNNVWKLSNYDSNSAPQSFKDACLNKGNEKVKGIENSEFQNFKKWCSRNYTVAEWLNKSGLSLLNNQSGDQKWNDAWKKYKSDPKNKNGSNPADNDVWKINDWANNKSKDTASEGFKTMCSTKANSKIKNKKDELYGQMSNWCV